MNLVLAIDPGAKGGVISVNGAGRIAVRPLPDTETDRVHILLSMAQEARAARQTPVLVLERVGGYVGGAGAPGSAMFNFGKGVGILLGAGMALGYRIVEVTPQCWQKDLGLGTSGASQIRSLPGDSKEQKKKAQAERSRLKKEWKNKLKDKAQKLYPEFADKITLDTADAALILEWYKHHYTK